MNTQHRVECVRRVRPTTIACLGVRFDKAEQDGPRHDQFHFLQKHFTPRGFPLGTVFEITEGQLRGRTGRSGANPGELRYKGVAAVNSAQSSSAGQSRGLSQAPMTSLNNPTTNANYGNASSALLQGLCGAKSTENSSANMNLNNPSTSPASSPNTSPSTRDRGET